MSEATIIKPPKDEVPDVHYVRVFFGENVLITLGYRTAEAARSAYKAVVDKADLPLLTDDYGNACSLNRDKIKAVLLTSTKVNSTLAGAIKLADLQEQKPYAEKLGANATLWGWVRRIMGQGAIQHPGTEYRQ